MSFEITEERREQVKSYAQRQIEIMQRIVDGSATENEVFDADIALSKEERLQYQQTPEYQAQLKATDTKKDARQKRIIQRRKVSPKVKARNK